MTAGMTDRAPTPHWRGLNTTIISIASLVDGITYSVVIPLLPGQAARFNASPAVIGLLFAAFPLAQLISPLFVGAASDRWGRRAPMVFGLFVTSGSTLLFAYGNSVFVLFAARILQGIATSITSVTENAVVSDLYAVSEQGRIRGLLTSFSVFGQVVGFPLGGWLFELGGYALPFLLLAAVAALDGVARLTLRMHGPLHSRPLGSFRRGLLEPAALPTLMAALACSGMAAMLEPVLTIELQWVAHLRPAVMGTLVGIAAMTASVLNPLFGTLADRYGGRKIAVLGLVLTAISLTVLPFEIRAGPLLVTTAGLILIWSATFMTMTAITVLFFSRSGDHHGDTNGVLSGIFHTATSAGLTVGSATSGALYELLGFRQLAAVWAAVILVLSLVLRSSSRPRPAKAAWPIEAPAPDK